MRQVRSAMQPAGGRLGFPGLVVVGGALAIALAAAFQPLVDPRLLFMDTITAARVSGYCCRVYYGVLTHLGVVAWCVAAAAAGIAALACARHGGRAFAVLAFAGLLSLLLGLDDLLLLHELVLPRLGVPQTLVLGGYALLGGAYGFIQRRQLLRRRGGLLLLAFALFAVSIGVDALLHPTHPLAVSLEDGAKFVGVFAWAAFHVREALTAIAELVEGAA